MTSWSGLGRVARHTLARALEMERSGFQAPVTLSPDNCSHNTHYQEAAKTQHRTPATSWQLPVLRSHPTLTVWECTPFTFQPWPSSPMLGMSCLYQRRRGVIYSRWLTESLRVLWDFNPLALNSKTIPFIRCVAHIVQACPAMDDLWHRRGASFTLRWMLC